MSASVDHIAGHTVHARKGAVENAFRYSIDYVLLDAEADVRAPSLFGRNGRGVISVCDSDHGGPPGRGRGAVWVREVLAAHRIGGVARIELLTQPRMLGHVFNPVSFWLCRRADDALIAVIAEVGNTYGDRHSYLCRHDDARAITRHDELSAAKIFHVSPFQPVAGGYTFSFDITSERIDIRIDYARDGGGLVATLAGRRRALSNRRIVQAMLRRPLGTRRVLALIHWQAIRLWWKGAAFRQRPDPPSDEISG